MVVLLLHTATVLQTRDTYACSRLGEGLLVPLMRVVGATLIASTLRLGFSRLDFLEELWIDRWESLVVYDVGCGSCLDIFT